MPGLIFGVIDNGIMLAGAFFGLSIEKAIPLRLSRGTGAIIGAGIGNAVSDFCGGIGEGDPALAFGTFTGCVLALILIPVLSRLKQSAGKNPEK